MNKKKENPIHIHKGQNYLRYLAILILLMISTLSIIGTSYLGYGTLILLPMTIFGLLTIRFPFLYVYREYFVIEKKSIIKKLNDRYVYKYYDLNEIIFIEGYLNWSLLIILTLFGKAAQGGFSKPDRMILKLHNEKIRFVYRFGRKEEFKKVVLLLKNKISIIRNG